MRKLCKKIVSCMLVVALTFSLVPISENLGLDLGEKAKAATNPTAYDNSYVVDSKIIPDTNLLNALKQIIGTNFTFGQLKSYTGDIDLSTYKSIISVEGLGYALKAKSINLSNLTNVTEIKKDEFQNCEFETFVLPSSITEIGDGAFRYCSNLKTINFPDSLLKIHAQAFDGCTVLNNIVIPKNIVKIGNNAFSSCKALETIVIPDGINATSENSSDDAENGIGSNVFWGCSGLKSIVLGAGMTAIPVGFLQGTTSLRQINIPEAIISIRDAAFAQSGLFSIDISKNTKITTIGKNVFQDCAALSSVKVPDSITKIDNYAFCNCKSLRNLSFFENLPNIKEVGAYSFEYCVAESVNIPSSVEKLGTGAFADSEIIKVEFKDFPKNLSVNMSKDIGKEAFKNGKILETVKFPVESQDDARTSVNIGESAFEDCIELKSVNFPRNIRKIGDRGFKGCGSETTNSGEFKGTLNYILPQYVSETYSAQTPDKVTLCSEDIPAFYRIKEGYINKASMDNVTDKTAGAVKIFIVSSSGTANLYNQVFTGLEIIDLSEVKNLDLGKEVFSDCCNLKTVYLPEDIVEIPVGTFQNCYSEYTTAFNKTKKLEDKAEDAGYRELDVEWGQGLRTVVVGKGTVGNNNHIQVINEKAFYNCRSLVLEDDLPVGLTYIGTSAFEFCQSIGSLTMPENVQYIGKRAFKDCSKSTDKQTIYGSGLKKLDMRSANKIEYIGDSAFENCTFETFQMNHSAPLITVCEGAFRNCQFLQVISLSDQVQYVMRYAIASCGCLETLDIPDSCSLDPDLCRGTIGDLKKTRYNSARGTMYITDEDEKIYIVTKNFKVTIRPMEKELTVRENQNFAMPVSSVIYGSQYSIEEVKIGDFIYTFDNLGMPKNAYDASPLLPKLEARTKTLEKTAYDSAHKFDVQTLILTGKTVSQKNAVDVQINYSFTYTGEDAGVQGASVVSYVVDVAKNPCIAINANDEYYARFDATKETVISPEFVAEDPSSEITDVVSWEIVSGDELITTVDNGKTLSVKSTKSGYGTALVRVKAGSVSKDIYVHIVAPASSISLSSTKVDMLLDSNTTLTATANYSSSYAAIKDEFPDDIVFTSDNPGIVKVENRREVDNTTVYDLKAVGVGTAVITATAQASGVTSKCTVVVTADNLGVILTDSNNNVVSNNSNVELINKTGLTYTYAMTQNVNSNSIVVEAEDASIVSGKVNATSKTVTLTGLKKGSTNVYIYPAIGSKENNATVLRVSVDGDINKVSLLKKTISLGETASVFVSMKNVFNTTIDSASEADYDSITGNKIEFVSSQPDYVSVDKYGNVTVNKLSNDFSTVTITFNAYRDDTVVYSTSTTVTVKYPIVKEINISGNKTLNPGQTMNIKIGVVPQNASYRSIAVTTHGTKNIVTYEFDSKTNTIKIVAKNTGSVDFIVTARNEDYSSVKKEFTVTVVKKAAPQNATNVSVGKVKQKKPKAGKKKITVKWKKVTGASGYQIQMSKKKKKGFKTIKTLKSGSKVTFVKKKLKRKKKYYFRIRAYVKVGSKKKYGKFSAVKCAKVK